MGWRSIGRGSLVPVSSPSSQVLPLHAALAPFSWAPSPVYRSRRQRMAMTRTVVPVRVGSGRARLRGARGCARLGRRDTQCGGAPTGELGYGCLSAGCSQRGALLYDVLMLRVLSCGAFSWFWFFAVCSLFLLILAGTGSRALRWRRACGTKRFFLPSDLFIFAWMEDLVRAPMAVQWVADSALPLPIARIPPPSPRSLVVASITRVPLPSQMQGVEGALGEEAMKTEVERVEWRPWKAGARPAGRFRSK
uniref:Uncharacterized protein n=1 Tax=Arundo donax TaxID=35708 RepID=A0A0A9F2K2_ARUDO